MTPFELYIENQAYELRFRRDKIIDLQLLNSIMNIFGETSLDFDDIFGYKTLKDYNLKTVQDFFVNGKIDMKGWKKYLKEVVLPAKNELGMEVK